MSGDPISSTKFNTLVQDLESDANVDRPVAAGGTGASTAAGARTNLGLVIGTDVQAFDAGLLSIAGLTTLADRSIYTTASDTYAVYTLTAAGRAILDDADASAQRTTLGLGNLSTVTASAFALTILDDADAATVRATIGAGTGSGDLLAANNLSDLASASTARTNLGLGTAALKNTGTSGDAVPLLNAANTWSARQTISAAIAPTASVAPTWDTNTYYWTEGGFGARYDGFQHRWDYGASRTEGMRLDSGGVLTIGGSTAWHAGNDGPGSGLDADTVDGAHVGTSGAAIPLLNAANTFSAVQTLERAAGNEILVFSNTTTTHDLHSVFINTGTAMSFRPAPSGSIDATKDFYYDFTNSRWTFDEVPYVSTNAIWHAGNDGAGSGLDADTVDGAHVGTSGATIPLLNGANTFSAAQTFSNGILAPNIELFDPTATFIDFKNDAGADFHARILLTGGTGTGGVSGTLQVFAATFTCNSNLVWHAGNDGAGSGLDADTLDGVQGSAFAQLASANIFSVAGTNRFVNTADAAANGSLSIESDRATPANGDSNFFDMKLSNSVGTQTTFARLRVFIDDVTNASEDGNLRLYTITAGTLSEAAKFTSTLATLPGSIKARANVSAETSGTLTSASANSTIQLTGNPTIDNSVFTAGDIIVMYAGASARTITAGTITTMRLDGTATTGSRTLAAYGMAVLFFVSATEVVVSGAAVT